ncbi:MAG: gliding motility-associated C-terminal domain-containing protein, partial [Paludibacter sp.]|nr:gliding motility-associated C-terminal domain-containing protein [Paludibacter sp.]
QYRDLNPQSQDKEKHFYLESQIFSPDNDGDNDVCVLRYEVPMAGYLVNITVLSATGEKVFALAEQYIAGKNGYFMWDGRNSTGRISNIGIYVFYIEIFHPESGERKQIKLPVVLSSR